MVGAIVALLIFGLIAGLFARAAVHRRQHMGIGATILLGITGSSMGGFSGFLLLSPDTVSGLVRPSS